MSSEHTAEVELAPNRYYDRHFKREAIKLLPGEYYIARPGKLIVTVLGSCVAACIRDRNLGLGGMNHFLLPAGDSSGVQWTESGRYGAYAMELVINQLIKMGANRAHLEAKVFGGANVLSSITQQSVGHKNAEFVLNYLEAENIPVIASDLLTPYPRKVYFFTENGQVLVKKLKKQHNDTIRDREERYLRRLDTELPHGDVELFE
ncbi:chemoreceptor glutamine deamidase CheD [Reinekea blandensis]|uniref:Probable chemoreceptor glutamine deamidase CheD n=1 Tax=Reinekea blandensis MED297 TaxID=314283 RepID=A4BJG7_9GAMM|nr:chemoreceptor glutamine deamidase CheD [Reinekea blandensis]EAR07739.1 chemotaxis protein CheD [Reinekea sp. MED297] [Reinekea blandensis MED297]